MTIAQSLRRFREAYRLSKAAAAKAAGINAASYTYEDEGGSRPNSGIIVTLALKFNVSTDYLLGLTDDPRPRPMLNEAAADETAAPEQTSVVTAPAAGMTLESRFDEMAARVARMEKALKAAGIEI